jgi:hypothetical protein
MPSAGFKPAIPQSKRPQTLALDRSANGIGKKLLVLNIINNFLQENYYRRTEIP